MIPRAKSAAAKNNGQFRVSTLIQRGLFASLQRGGLLDSDYFHALFRAFFPEHLRFSHEEINDQLERLVEKQCLIKVGECLYRIINVPNAPPAEEPKVATMGKPPLLLKLTNALPVKNFDKRVSKKIEPTKATLPFKLAYNKIKKVEVLPPVVKVKKKAKKPPEKKKDIKKVEVLPVLPPVEPPAAKAAKQIKKPPKKINQPLKKTVNKVEEKKVVVIQSTSIFKATRGHLIAEKVINTMKQREPFTYNQLLTGMMHETIFKSSGPAEKCLDEVLTWAIKHRQLLVADVPNSYLRIERMYVKLPR